MNVLLAHLRARFVAKFVCYFGRGIKKLFKSATEKHDSKSIFHFRSQSAIERTRTEFRDPSRR